MNVNLLRYWHGTLMVHIYLHTPLSYEISHTDSQIIAFGVFMSFGIFVARYLKQYYWWFPLHILVQVLAVVLAFTGFILCLVMSAGNHFSNLHSWFGISVMALAFLAPILGWAADLLYNPSRHSPPLWPDRSHWWTGRLTVLVAYVTIILGMRQLQASTVFQYGFGGMVVIYLGLYLYLELYHWWNARESKSSHTKLLENESSHD